MSEDVWSSFDDIWQTIGELRRAVAEQERRILELERWHQQQLVTAAIEAMDEVQPLADWRDSIETK